MSAFRTDVDAIRRPGDRAAAPQLQPARPARRQDDMPKDPTSEEILEADARARGDTTAANYWRAAGRHVSRADGAEYPGPFPPGFTRATIVPAIERMLLEYRHDPAPGEALTARSDAYLGRRYSSLLALGVRDRKMRTDAIRRNDGAAVLRLDARPTDAELCSARARVFHSGVPEAEREGVAQQLAARQAWERARETYLNEATQLRLDSMDEPARAPTASDIAQARRDLQARVPFGADARADAFAAAQHEAAVTARAHELAAKRLAAEARELLRTSLPSPPPVPRLPQQTLGATDAGRYRTNSAKRIPGDD
jgi:hypothetical protein